MLSGLVAAGDLGCGTVDSSHWNRGSGTTAAGPPPCPSARAKAAERLRSVAASGGQRAGFPGSSRYRGFAAESPRARERIFAGALGRHAFLLLFTAVLLLVGRTASAQPKGAVHVLGIDSDEAEDQADALSGALRSRARAQPGWTVADATTSLSMLTAALKCPQRPDMACLQKIAEQLKTDRFIWGLLSKSGKGQVTAEIHLYVKGKPDVFAKETFSDNLKDQNDENLRRIAGRLFDRLVVGQGAGTLTVKAGDGGGAVLVDGVEKAQLDHGQATLELKPGTYSLEVRAPGSAPAKQTVTVTAGAESTLALTLTPESAVTAPPAGGIGNGATPPGGGETHGTSGRKIAGWTFVVVGAIAAGVSVYEVSHYLSLASSNKTYRNDHSIQIAGPPPSTDVPSKDTICSIADTGNTTLKSGQTWTQTPTQADARTACDRYSQATTASVIGWIAGGAAILSVGVGIYLLASDAGHDPVKVDATTGKADANERSFLSRLRVTPTYYGPRDAGMNVALTF